MSGGTDSRRLPNAHLAVVDRDKVVDYLLNASHPDNGGKARFFESLGFSRETPGQLMAALQGLARDGELVETIESLHGQNMLSKAGCRATLVKVRDLSEASGSSTVATMLRDW